MEFRLSFEREKCFPCYTFKVKFFTNFFSYVRISLSISLYLSLRWWKVSVRFERGFEFKNAKIEKWMKLVDFHNSNFRFTNFLYFRWEIEFAETDGKFIWDEVVVLRVYFRLLKYWNGRLIAFFHICWVLQYQGPTAIIHSRDFHWVLVLNMDM